MYEFGKVTPTRRVPKPQKKVKVTNRVKKFDPFKLPESAKKFISSSEPKKVTEKTPKKPSNSKKGKKTVSSKKVLKGVKPKHINK